MKTEQEIKEAAMRQYLPLHEHSLFKHTAIERFVYNHEPIQHDKDFRKELMKVLVESFIAGAQFAAPKWIPVEEALPEEDSFLQFWSEDVWVTDGQHVQQGYYHYEWKSWHIHEDQGLFSAEQVTHFMKIFTPKPPNNDQKSEL